MRAATFSCLLLVANLVLVCANLVLSSALRSAEARLAAVVQKEGAETLQALRKETAHLLAERTRLALVAQDRAPKEQPVAASEDKRVNETEDLPIPADETQPLKDDVPILSEEEKGDLVRRRDRITVRPDDTLLLQPEAKMVVGDAAWNPTGKSIAPDELEELSRLMAAYRYYARTSRTERSQSLIKPALAQMENVGAFVEYPAQEPEGLPPPVTTTDGTQVYTVSGGSPTPGVRRLFYFYPEEYPEIYHGKAVEEERSLEAYVRAYEFINGPLTEASSTAGDADR